MFFILFCGCASLWGAPQLSCGRSPVGCSPILLRARGAPRCLAGAHIHGPPIVLRACSLALYEVLPDVSRACSLMGCSPICFLQATGCSPLSSLRALYEVLSLAPPQLFRRRTHSWEHFPIGFLQCCWHELSFFCCWYCGPPFCQAMMFTEPGALGQSELQVEGAMRVPEPPAKPGGMAP